MVSKEVKESGEPVETLEGKEYRKLSGLLRECLPTHHGIEIERKEGGKIELWSTNPPLLKRALKQARDMLKKYGTDAISKVG